MKVALYARVSTDDKEQNPERQFIKCRQYAELHNHEVLGEWEDWLTGDTPPSSRPGFSKLLKKKPEGIILYSIDRLTRQHPTKVMNLLAYYRDSGLKIISISEPIFNMESEFAEPMQYFLTWWNNYFLKKLKADIKSGLDRARAEGKRLGAPPVKFNKFRAAHLLSECVSVRAIGSELGVSAATVWRFRKVWLENPDLYIKDGVVSQSDDKETGEK